MPRTGSRSPGRPPRAEEEWERSARRQELVWQLELRALAGEELGTVMDDAVALVARELDVELAGVAEILPGNGYGGDLISDLPR